MTVRQSHWRFSTLRGCSRRKERTLSISRPQQRGFNLRTTHRALKMNASPILLVYYRSSTDHTLVLAKFLDDFARDGDKIVIETYYPPPKEGGAPDDNPGSKQYEVSLACFLIFDVSNIHYRADRLA